MKSQKYNLWAVVAIILLCIAAVLLFPIAFHNTEVYKAVIYAAIGVVILLLLYLIKVHVFDSGGHEHVPDH